MMIDTTKERKSLRRTIMPALTPVEYGLDKDVSYWDDLIFPKIIETIV